MRLVDPDDDASFRRMERRARKQFDQEYYWLPGETMPERMSDLEAA